MTRAVVGVDLGGTNVRAGVFDEAGQIVGGSAVEHPSRAQEGTDAILAAIVQAIRDAVAVAKVEPLAVGMAVPGHIDNDRGVVKWSPNFGHEINGVFECWRNQPLREGLERHVTYPILMGNDANLAALGEYRFGAGRNKASCLVMVTLGTGVGGGVVMSSRSVFGKAEGTLMLVGGNGGGAELGHVIIQMNGLDCNAGSYGAVEAFCQRDAIVTRAIHRVQRGRKTIIPELVEGDLSKITPKILSIAADQGDALAQQIWAETGAFLGVAIGSYINIFAPDIVAVGGQIAKAGEWILGPARVACADTAIPSLFADCQIVQAEQIDDAGMLGGAALAFEGLS